MSTEVKFTRKTKEEINALPIEDGQIIFSTNSSEIYMDNGDKRNFYGGEQINSYTKEESDEKYATKLEIPNTLPNPYPLQFTGAIEDSYDGSINKIIEIPVGEKGANSVNGIEQVDGNITLNLNDIPTTDNVKYIKLINRIVLDSMVSQITIDKDMLNQSFALKSIKVNIFIPENSVPNESTGTSVRALINNISDENSYSNNGSAASYLSLGQMRTAGHASQINMDSVGANGNYVLIGVNPTRSFFRDSGNDTVQLTAERYSASTLFSSDVWEYINSITFFLSNETYPFPVGTTIEVWGY